MNLSFTEKAFDLLVGERQFKIVPMKTIFVTVHPNPQVLVDTRCRMVSKLDKTKIKYKDIKKPYALLPQKSQYDYCMQYIETSYLQFIQGDYEMLGVVEFDGCDNIHAHFLINADRINDSVELGMLRRDILNDPITIKNLKTKHSKDWMNSIVFVNDSEDDRIDYFMKDQDKILKHFKNYYYSTN